MDDFLGGVLDETADNSELDWSRCLVVPARFESPEHAERTEAAYYSTKDPEQRIEWPVPAYDQDGNLERLSAGDIGWLQEWGIEADEYRELFAIAPKTRTRKD